MDHSLIIACIIFFGIPALLLYRSYKASAGSQFIVRFPGGGLAFSMKYYSEEERNEFQEILTRLVDQAKG